MTLCYCDLIIPCHPPFPWPCGTFPTSVVVSTLPVRTRRLGLIWLPVPQETTSPLQR